MENQHMNTKPEKMRKMYNDEGWDTVRKFKRTKILKYSILENNPRTKNHMD